MLGRSQYLLSLARRALASAGRQRPTSVSSGSLVSEGSLSGSPVCSFSASRTFASNHVMDSIITINCIDTAGNVHALRGLEGQSLAEVFAANTSILGQDAVAASPEGRGKVEAHVKIPSEWFEVVKEDEGEAREVLEELVGGEGGLDGHSRLGSRVVLGKEVEGMTVSVGGVYPWKSL